MNPFNKPLGGNEMPRFAGIASMFRMPVQSDASGLDVAICGVGLDIGTSNRVGTRYGPRQIRSESVLVRPYGGTPEPAGLTASQGIEIIRGCFGLNLVGCDLVEVSPPYDTTGNTALLAANLVFEMLCSLPGCKRR